MKNATEMFSKGDILEEYLIRIGAKNNPVKIEVIKMEGRKPITLTTKKIYKIWCDDCYAWVDNFELNDISNYICCEACGNGLVMVV